MTEHHVTVWWNEPPVSKGDIIAGGDGQLVIITRVAIEDLCWPNSYTVWGEAHHGTDGQCADALAGWAHELHRKNVDPTLDQILARQQGWSMTTFGPGPRTGGIIKHIRKELAEIEASQGALEEWVDVVILGLDGAWRTGATPHGVVSALRDKQARNESRSWPDWREFGQDDPIEHIREDAG